MMPAKMEDCARLSAEARLRPGARPGGTRLEVGFENRGFDEEEVPSQAAVLDFCGGHGVSGEDISAEGHAEPAN